MRFRIGRKTLIPLALAAWSCSDPDGDTTGSPVSRSPSPFNGCPLLYSENPSLRAATQLIHLVNSNPHLQRGMVQLDTLVRHHRGHPQETKGMRVNVVPKAMVGLRVTLGTRFVGGLSCILKVSGWEKTVVILKNDGTEELRPCSVLMREAQNGEIHGLLGVLKCDYEKALKTETFLLRFISPDNLSCIETVPFSFSPSPCLSIITEAYYREKALQEAMKFVGILLDKYNTKPEFRAELSSRRAFGRSCTGVDLVRIVDENAASYVDPVSRGMAHSAAAASLLEGLKTFLYAVNGPLPPIRTIDSSTMVYIQALEMLDILALNTLPSADNPVYAYRIIELQSEASYYEYLSIEFLAPMKYLGSLSKRCLKICKNLFRGPILETRYFQFCTGPWESPRSVSADESRRVMEIRLNIHDLFPLEHGEEQCIILEDPCDPENRIEIHLGFEVES
jgi:hypothetical protein